MFFSSEDRLVLNNLTKKIQILSNQIEIYEGSRNTENVDISKKTEENLKKVNDMTLELKGVVSQSRAALSERKAFEEFVVMAEKKLIEIVESTKDYCDKKIKKELTETRSLIKQLTTAFEKAEPYTRLVQMGNAIERIEEKLEKPKKIPKS